MKHYDVPGHDRPLLLSEEHARILGCPEHPPEGPARPPGNASLEVWRSYAQALGADPEAIQGLTRNQLRDSYGEVQHGEG